MDPVKNITDFQSGQHLCHIYRTENEHREVVTPLLRQGLEQGEKVIYIVDTHPSNTILDYLRDGGINVQPCLARGQLKILNGEESYMREGIFDPDRMIAFLGEFIEEALSEGYPAARGIGEMSWALKGLPGSERLMEYEAKLHRYFPSDKYMAICQYDRRQFHKTMLLDVIANHNLRIIGTEIFDDFSDAATKLSQEIATKPPKRDIEASRAIFLIDDDETVLRAFEALFTARGYQVITARNGDEAVQVFETRKEEIGVVILDVIMPGMNCEEVYDRLTEIDPKVRVLLASGYGKNDLNGPVTKLLERGCIGFINKPFDFRRLEEIVTEILGKKERKRDGHINK